MCRTHEKVSKTYFSVGKRAAENKKIVIIFHKIRHILNS
ncbi:hypothetical protein BN1221_00456 [Brenneria goodwinii]|uniref:Uncharacterized protein n=1 Tax=Brenneria goodwinii TaxID=1109412 RepID=A0A0G4JQ70_9GAMM|nr:hypothetical protein BN1221_00456 [Brenneria goodwinii]